MAYEITKYITQNGDSLEVYYVGRDSRLDTIWSDNQSHHMSITRKTTADNLAKELGENATVRKI